MQLPRVGRKVGMLSEVVAIQHGREFEFKVTCLRRNTREVT